MKQIKITNNLYLVEVPVERQNAAASNQQVTANNHIWICDRSGSMSWTIKDLIEDMIGKLNTLEDGDTLSVGWFSGEGQFDFILKGSQVSSAQSKERIATVLRKYASTVGCTCFSEILGSTNKLVDDLTVFGNLFSLVFFTDGCPVVSNYQAEITAINKSIDALKGKLTSVLLVGYGAYYNKELMANMAARFSGTLVHSANLGDYSKSLTEFLFDVRDTGGRVSVSLPKELQLQGCPNWCFSLNQKTVVSYNVDDNKLAFVMPRKGKSAYYAIVLNPVKGAEELNLDDVSAQRAAYAAALLLVQRVKTDLALEILGALGDVNLIDMATNAFTNDEYGRVEARIRDAVAGPSGRFVTGRKLGYLPKRDAFCVVDLIELLQSDEGARFLPYNKAFVYNRIGLKTKPKEGVTVDFKAETDPAVPVDTLTWNDSMLNLSITCRIPGTVKLDKSAKKFGFANPYPTFIWRSYSIVKDGNVNVTRLPMIISEATFNKLKAEGVVQKDAEWTAGDCVILELDKIPVMNRAIADGRTSAKTLAQKAIKEISSEYLQKVLKAAKTSLEAAGKTDRTQQVLSKEQLEYLATFYISRNGFSAPSETVDPTDKYTAKEFTIKIKGFSGAPKIADVEKKLQEGKSRTPAEVVMETAISIVDAATDCRKNLTKVNAALANVQSDLRSVRKDIQKTKFAILLGKQWFSEFSDRSNSTLDVDGRTVTFALREVEIEI